MTLTITLNLSPEAEAELQESIARKDAESARQLLVEAVAPTVESLLSQAEGDELEQKSPAQLSDAEFEALADRLAEEVDRLIPSWTPALSDYALNGEGVYKDRPKFEQVETLARETQLSLSQLLIMTIKDFIRHYRTRRLVEQINEAYADGLDEEERQWLRYAKQSQRRILEKEKEEW